MTISDIIFFTSLGLMLIILVASLFINSINVDILWFFYPILLFFGFNKQFLPNTKLGKWLNKNI